MMYLSATALSLILPYSANLSYSSVSALLNFLGHLFQSHSIKITKILISSIHFCINRSIRENIPLMIMLMKNLSLFCHILKKEPDFEECKQLILLIKSINSELKQNGTTFTSNDLELFFSDPSCEHFASPVLRPPIIDFDFIANLEKPIKNMLLDFAQENGASEAFKEFRNFE